MIRGYSLPTVTKAMREGEVTVMNEWNGQPVGWSGKTTHQQKLIQYYNSSEIQKLENCLSDVTNTEITVSLSEIKIETVLEVVVEWLQSGVKARAGNYKGALLKKGFTVLSEGTVRINTTCGDTVVLHRYPIIASDMMDFVSKSLREMRLLEDAEPDESYDELVFPIVDLSDEVDMEPILNMGCCNAAAISKASQKINFSMDEIGAKAKVEVEIHMTRGCAFAAKRFTIDDPFLVLMYRENHSIPYLMLNVDAKFLIDA